MAAYRQGTLKLDRVTGIRHDLGQRMTYVPVKKEKKLPTVEKSRKASSNIKQNKWKF